MPKPAHILKPPRNRTAVFAIILSSCERLRRTRRCSRHPKQDDIRTRNHADLLVRWKIDQILVERTCPARGYAIAEHSAGRVFLHPCFQQWLWTASIESTGEGRHARSFCFRYLKEASDQRRTISAVIHFRRVAAGGLQTPCREVSRLLGLGCDRTLDGCGECPSVSDGEQCKAGWTRIDSPFAGAFK